jgi:protein-tyrosine phosphatase
MAQRFDLTHADDIDAELASAGRLLDEGGVIVLPTETVYGVAGRVDRSDTVAKLNQLRGVDAADAATAKPLTIHLADASQASKYLGDTSDLGRRMMRKLWPGPVGLVFDVSPARQAEVARQLGVTTALIYENDTITLRCPDHPVAAELIAAASGPVAVVKSPAGTGERQPEQVDAVVDAGAPRFNKPSTLVRVKGDSFEVVRAGVWDERIIQRLLRTTVLFVCSGNTCRSPMAEAIARKILLKKLNTDDAGLERRGIHVASAGVFAVGGVNATPQAVTAVRELGADLTRHRSRMLNNELINQADVIFTMGRSHAQAIRMMSPGSSSKVISLDPDGDIEDPIGADEEHYLSLARTMERLIEDRLDEKVIPDLAKP